MKETNDIDKYRRVLDYFTNDDGSGEFNTGSGKFELESASFIVCLQVEELQAKITWFISCMFSRLGISRRLSIT